MSRNSLTALLVALVLAPAGAWAQSYDRQNRWVRIVNDSLHTVVAVYAVPSRYNDRVIRSRDWIPTTVIRPGRSFQVNFDDGRGTCYFDIRAAGSNRRDWISRNFDVCRQGRWRLIN